MLSEAEITLIRQIHGHLCPMVLLGARTAKKARQLVMEEGHEPELFGYYRGYGCALDGIQLFSGCTWGNSNLVQLRGRNFSFILTKEGSSEGVIVTPQRDLLNQIRQEKTPESKSTLMRIFETDPDEDILQTDVVGDLGVLSGFPGG